MVKYTTVAHYKQVPPIPGHYKIIDEWNHIAGIIKVYRTKQFRTLVVEADIQHWFIPFSDFIVGEKMSHVKLGDFRFMNEIKYKPVDRILFEKIIHARKFSRIRYDNFGRPEGIYTE